MRYNFTFSIVKVIEGRSLCAQTPSDLTASLACSMLRIITAGLCTLRQVHSKDTAFTHLHRSVVCRNMSAAATRPVSLLGTMAFGGRADAEQSREMVKAFLDRGHKQVDTALMYMDGKSEAIIGDMNLPKTGTLLGAVLLV